MKFISVIPARSGSKGLKNKNIYPINNKTLISYTFKQIKESKLKNSYVLTNSKLIKKIASKYKINNQYVRPNSVSKSTSSLIDTIYHFFNWTEKKKIFFDYLMVLQPTSPLRSYQDINKSIDIIRKKKCKSLFSISESLEHPYETINVKKKKWKYVLKKSKNFYRRQDFDIKSYFINGAIYIIHRDLIKKRKTYDKNNHSLLYMPKSRSLEINDIEDIKIIEPILKKR